MQETVLKRSPPAKLAILNDIGARLIRFSAIHELGSGMASLERLPDVKKLMATLEPGQFLDLGISQPAGYIVNLRNIKCFVGSENKDGGHLQLLRAPVIGIRVGLTQKGIRYKITLDGGEKSRDPTHIVNRWRSLTGVLVDRKITSEAIKGRLFQFTTRLNDALREAGIRP